MKEAFKKAYPELTAKYLKMFEDGKSLKFIWLAIFSNRSIAATRCTRMVKALFDLSQDEACEIENRALDVDRYRTLHEQGVSNEEIFREIFTHTKRLSLSTRLLGKVSGLSGFDDLVVSARVFRESPELNPHNSWEAIDTDISIPLEVTQPPSHHFYSVSSDVMDRWRIVGFLIADNREYLTFRFCTFSDDLPFDIWEEDEEDNLNALEWSIFTRVTLDQDLLADLIQIARLHAAELLDSGQHKPTFSLMTHEEKEQYRVIPAPALLSTENEYLQSYHHYRNDDETETILSLSPHLNRLSIITVQLKDSENYWKAKDDSLGILHLTKQGVNEFCHLLESFLDRS